MLMLIMIIKLHFDVIIRITADNPLIDPTMVDGMIKKFMSNTYDYLTNAHVRTFPYGTEVEIFWNNHYLSLLVLFRASFCVPEYNVGNEYLRDNKRASSGSFSSKT